ncbi:MAG: hypothetical protein WCE63_11450 [Acidobacteriaceae bacterium]
MSFAGTAAELDPYKFAVGCKSDFVLWTAVEEYVLIALVAFAATVGMKDLATDIKADFTHIGTTLTTHTA